MSAPKPLLILLTLLLFVACTPTPLTPTPRPTRAPVAPELAVQFALDALHTYSAYGKLIGTPTVMRGQVMTLAAAYQLVNNKPLAPDSPLAYRQENQVWLVVSRGTWLLRVPGGHGDPLRRTPTINPKEITVPDLWNAILFDAVTGEVYDQGGIPTSQLPQLETLPPLLLPK